MRTGLAHFLQKHCSTATLSMGLLALTVLGSAKAEDHEFALKLHSSSFVNGGTLPLSAISNIPDASGRNTCTPDGSPGGNQSPELSWTHAPEDTKTFVVVMYDVTASFTHWGMYNIAASTNALPMNAGLAQSTFGTQIFNDFGDPNYDGPCPPTTLKPTVHRYVITVYALDISLHLGEGDFVEAQADGLFHALLQASQHEHLLASASVTGLFSAVPTMTP